VGMFTVLLFVAGALRLLNLAGANGLETNPTGPAAARGAPEQRRASQEERLLSRRGESSSGATTPSPGAESKAAKAEADLAQVLKEKADLQTKWQASQAEVTSLQNKTQEQPRVEATS